MIDLVTSNKWTARAAWHGWRQLRQRHPESSQHPSVRKCMALAMLAAWRTFHQR